MSKGVAWLETSAWWIVLRYKTFLTHSYLIREQTPSSVRETLTFDSTLRAAEISSDSGLRRRARLHTWSFWYLWGACGDLAGESVGISVWWSDFSIQQAFCKEIQPDDLPAKYIDCKEEFHEAPAIL